MQSLLLLVSINALFKVFPLLSIPSSILSFQLPCIFIKILRSFIYFCMYLRYFKLLFYLFGPFMVFSLLTIFQAKNYRLTLRKRIGHSTTDPVLLTQDHYFLFVLWAKRHFLFYLEVHLSEDSLSSEYFRYCWIGLRKQNPLSPLSYLKACFISTIRICLYPIRPPLQWCWKLDLLIHFIRWLPSYFLRKSQTFISMFADFRISLSFSPKVKFCAWLFWEPLRTLI